MALPNKDSFEAVGGALNDYAPAVDATTDLPAAADNLARADVAAETRTAMRAYVVFTPRGSAGACTVVEHDATWGDDLSLRPTVSETSAGRYTVTWPSVVPDALGNGTALLLRRGLAGCTVAGYTFGVTVAAPNVAAVQADLGSSGAATDPGGDVVLEVW